MTQEEIIQLMENPCLLNKDTLPHIRRLTEEFPYFQTIRMLYVMNLNQIKNLSFYSELKLAAMYASDRKKLFYHITGEQFADLKGYTQKYQSDLSIDKTFSLIENFLSGTEETDNDLEIAINPENPFIGDYSSYVLQEPVENTEDTDNPLMHQDIIDNFLEEDKKQAIKITLEPDPASPVNEPRLEEPVENQGEDMFFMETLVNIYIKQGRYAKAIKIFEKLSLNNPEKSVYFADQIRILQKKINNEK